MTKNIKPFDETYCDCINKDGSFNMMLAMSIYGAGYTALMFNAFIDMGEEKRKDAWDRAMEETFKYRSKLPEPTF